jgi:cytochrome c oxidase subunit IV
VFANATIRHAHNTARRRALCRNKQTVHFNLALVGWNDLVEIFLAYITMPIHIMLTVLLGLSIIKAALIVAYFMHLKFERLSLILTVVPMLVVCICLLLVFSRIVSVHRACDTNSGITAGCSSTRRGAMIGV